MKCHIYRPIARKTCRAALFAFLLGTGIWIFAGRTRITTGRPAASEVRWLHGVEEGLKLAGKSHRDVLINFTGRGWCYYCMLLDGAVFDQPEFASAANHFVLVELDSRAGEATSDAEADTAREIREWKSKYLVEGVPTVVLVDPQGRPFAYTGYNDEITPASFLGELERFRATRMSRDRAMNNAAAKSGAARAAYLNAALDDIAPNLGSLEERKGDVLLRWYGDAVEEICRLDSDGTLGLRTKYKRRQEELRLFVHSEQPFAKLRECKSHKDALAYIAATLPTVTEPEMIWRLETARQTYLEWDGRHAVAIENARRLLGRADLTRDQRDCLKDRIAFNLKNLSRYAESIAQLDELIAANQDRPNVQLRYLQSKAEYLLWAEQDDDHRAAIEAFRQWRARCTSRSDEWQTATYMSAVQFERLGRLHDALALRLELAEANPTPGNFLNLTGTYLALGDVRDAEKNLSQAERLIDSMHVTRRDQQETKDELTARATDLREQLSRLAEGLERKP